MSLKRIILISSVILVLVLICLGYYILIKSHQDDVNKISVNSKPVINNSTSGRNDDILKKPINVREVIDGPLVIDDFTFKGLNPDYQFNKSKNAVQFFLGQPIKFEEKDFKDPGVRERTYTYSNFVITTYTWDSFEEISDILITGNGPTTARGITVGDSIEKVIEKYGQAGDISYFKGKTYYHYFLHKDYDSSDDQFVLEFRLNENLVEKIKIYLYGE